MRITCLYVALAAAACVRPDKARYVLGWKPGDKAPSVVAKGPGGFDGVVVAGGR